MIYSMTAFARRQLEQTWGSMTWELRSVNHRYLECSFRLPETLRGLEPGIRDALRNKLSRGKVECQLRFQPAEGLQEGITINSDQVARLRQANDSILATIPDATPLSVAEYLRWPGVLKEPETDMDMLEQQALKLFEAALDDLMTTRQREGAQLGGFVEQRLVSIGDIVKEVRARMPEIIERQRSSILERLAELKLELDPARLEQELVMLAQKTDVDEELDRLESHLGEVGRVLKTHGQKGRRLDFLMQELNREANTLSSKSVVAETTRGAVELKVLIEQMREQIQNIE